MHKQKKKPLIIGILCMFITIIISLFLPGFLIQLEINQQMNKVFSATPDQYLASKTTLAKDSSLKMSSYEKINMINGSIDSTIQKVDISQANLTEIEAIQLAKYQIELLYENRLYPCSILSDYKNWYNYSSEVYQYTENAFNTYTSFLWDITFVKYDKSLTHRILMTEDGVILSAQVNRLHFFITDPEEVINTDSIKDIMKNYIKYNDDATFITMDNLPELMKSNYFMLNEYPNYKQNCMSFSMHTSYYTIQDYILYQYKNMNSYGIGIIETATTP